MLGLIWNLSEPYKAIFEPSVGSNISPSQKATPKTQSVAQAHLLLASTVPRSVGLQPPSLSSYS